MESSAALTELRIACGTSPARLARGLKISLREYRRWEREGVPATLKLGYLVAVARHVDRLDLADVFFREIASQIGEQILVRGTKIIRQGRKRPQDSIPVAVAA